MYIKLKQTVYSFRLLVQKYAWFWFLEKSLGIVSPPDFMNDFSRKKFLILYSVNWPNFIVWLPVLLEILDNMCIAILCFPGWDVISVETDFTFQVELFFYVTKKSREKFKHLENEKRFLGEINFLHSATHEATHIYHFYH